MPRLSLSRFASIFALAVALLPTAARAQTLEIGSSGTPNSTDSAFADIRTDIDLVRPATASGTLDTATFYWSTLGCPAAVKIKFFRRSGDTLNFLDERGPFDAVAAPTNVNLTPPVAVQEGDLIGITRLTTCGGPLTVTGFPTAGYVGFTGDVTSSVTLSLADATSPDVLSVLATGTATEALTRIIPAVASTPGNFASFFKTGIQLHNPWSTTISGRFIFPPAGVSGGAADPSLAFSVASGQTTSFDDIVASIGTTGLGSIDVDLPQGSPVPVIATRVYNDAGDAGTAGFTEDSVDPATSSETAILVAGSTGFLIAPSDLTHFRFNMGVRTLLSGASITFNVHDSTGALVHSITKVYAPTFFEQRSSTEFLGTFTLAPNDSIEIGVNSGSAIVYGATTDNTSNDPSIQFARVAFAIL